MSGSNGPSQVKLRLVAFGPSGAGKTATVDALAESMSPAIESDEAVDHRDCFDWMDYEGGRHKGQPISVHLVGVAGDGASPDAEMLVQTADAILFIADTTAAGLDASATSYRQVNDLLGALDGPRPSFVIHANKRDLDDVATVDDVRSRLGLDDDQIVVETVATTGTGVRQAFVYGVRLGLQHVDAMEEQGVGRPITQTTPTELLAWLTATTDDTGEEPTATTGEWPTPNDEADVETVDPDTTGTEGSDAEAESVEADLVEDESVEDVVTEDESVEADLVEDESVEDVVTEDESVEADLVEADPVEDEAGDGVEDESEPVADVAPEPDGRAVENEPAEQPEPAADAEPTSSPPAAEPTMEAELVAAKNALIPPRRESEPLPEEMNGDGFYVVDRPDWQDDDGETKAGRRKDDPEPVPPPPGPDSQRFEGEPPEAADEDKTVISKFVNMLRGD